MRIKKHHVGRSDLSALWSRRAKRAKATMKLRKELVGQISFQISTNSMGRTPASSQWSGSSQRFDQLSHLPSAAVSPRIIRAKRYRHEAFETER